MTDNTELKRLAEAATPGPWYQHGGIMQVLSHDCETVCETFEDDGECPDAQFIAAANPAAVLALIAENERLSAIFARPQNMNAKPADDYETLKKQFGALKTYAACQEKMRDHYRASAEKLSKLDRSQSAEEIGAERSVNEQLTNDLLKTEDERDQLRAEVAGLRTGYEAYERVNAELKAEVEGLRKLGPSKEIIWCACGDGYPVNSHGAGFMDANNGVCANCDAAQGQGEQS